MHPRISLHQVAMMEASTADFVTHCEAIEVRAVTLVTPKLDEDFVGASEAVAGRMHVESVNHPFALQPDLASDEEAPVRLLRAIEQAAALGANSVYLVTGGRGPLDWEQAATRFATMIAPCRDAAAEHGVELLVEPASAFNADIHIAHSLSDTLALAEVAGIGVCVDLAACWHEAFIDRLLARAVPMCGLVQVSDYVLGDRSAPCRAVPGDGDIPLERLIGTLLDQGYEGAFDLELVGPRIEKEGPEPATRRAAAYLSGMLERLGA